MNLDDADLTPAGANLLPRPVQVHRQTVATFTAASSPDPADIWEPFMRPTSMTSDGEQGNPYGSLRSALRLGGPIEDEPMDDAKKASQHTAQTVSHIAAGQQVRAALRLGQ